MIPSHGLHAMRNADVSELGREARSSGKQLFVLPKGIIDRASFFRAVRAVLPLDPPVLSDHVWDALSDSLWSGLDALETNDVTVIWPDSEAMESAHRNDFEIAKEILSNIATQLANPELTNGRCKRISILLV